MKLHVKMVVKKCSRRIWVLRNLRRNGIPEEKCLLVYKAQIRSVIEFGSPVYWPLLNETDMSELEKVQSNALKTVYGFEMSYSDVLEKAKIEKINDGLKKIDRRLCVEGIY